MTIERVGKKYVATEQPRGGQGMQHISAFLPAIGEGASYDEAIGNALEDIRENERFLYSL